MKKQAIKILLIFGMILFNFVNAKTSENNKHYQYQLNYLQASQVINVIQPHLSKDSILTGKGNILFAETSVESNQTIISMLQMLDKEQQQFLVEVKILNHKLDDWERKATKIIKGSSNKPVQNKRYSTKSMEKSARFFQLRLIEGYQGFINTGESFPTNHLLLKHNKFLPQTSYRKTSSGFYVKVRGVEKDRVILNISAQAQQRQNGSTAISNSESSSQITANKSEWTLLSATEGNRQGDNRKHYNVSSIQDNKHWYYIRVTNIN